MVMMTRQNQVFALSNNVSQSYFALYPLACQVQLGTDCGNSSLHIHFYSNFVFSKHSSRGEQLIFLFDQAE